MSKKSLISLGVACLMLLSVVGVSATAYTKSQALSMTVTGCKASLKTTCTYNTTGSTRWKGSYSDYKVSFTNTYGITMTGASWKAGGSDGAGYHTNTFTWKEKSYLLSDRNQTAVGTGTKKAEYKYTISNHAYTVTVK